MGHTAQLAEGTDQTGIREGLLRAGTFLRGTQDLRETADMILRAACRLERAEGGVIYAWQSGRLGVLAAYHDGSGLIKITEDLLSSQEPVSSDSVAAFVASTGRLMNIGDTFSLPPAIRFRINRDYDALTGRRTKTMLAVPVKCPGGESVGALVLVNRTSPGGKAVPFPPHDHEVLCLQASMAAAMLLKSLRHEELRREHLSVILRLSAAAEFRCGDTGGHIRRVSHVCGLLAGSLGLPARQGKLLEYAGAIHDIGKTGLPDAVAAKQGPYSDDERRAMRRHTLIGARILGEPQTDLLETAREVALMHHERWDGSGYPHGLTGEKIPLSGRVIGVADVFDALMTKRSYKPPYAMPMALEVIHSDRAKQFDPQVVEAFFEVQDEVRDYYRRNLRAA